MTDNTNETVSQYKQHRDQFNKYNTLSDTDKSHLAARNTHEKEMNRHFLALTDKEKRDHWQAANETVSDDNSRMEAYLKQIDDDLAKQ